MTLLAERHGLQVYHYDQTDLIHHQQLANTDPEVQTFMRASMDERWLHSTPEELMRRALRSFELRWSLVVEDLLAMRKEPLILAEGFGFTPVLLHHALVDQTRVIWLVPTEKI